MTNNYYVDLKTVLLSDYAAELKTMELIPSRKMLQENIENNFLCLKKNGIRNLDDLIIALKTPVKIKNFAEKTGLSEEYLAVLKREIASSQPKPVNFADIPNISKATIKKLEKNNIKNTKQLFDFIKTEKDRKEFCGKTAVPYAEILELTKLTDVSRIKWVGANFARLLVDSPCDTVKKVVQAECKTLYENLMNINEKKKYFKGKFGQNDMKLCILAAKNVPDAITY